MRRLHLVLGRVLGLVALLPTLLGVGIAEAAPGSAADPVRIMLVGDSVTHGAEGDWTWRYRLWKHFQASGVAVDLVGPYDGLYRLGNIFAPPTHSYVDPAFDQDHAARQGVSFEVRDVPIIRLVENHRPDIAVVMLGVNDVAFGGATGAQVDRRMREFVAEARAADPDLDLVIARTPQRWFEEAADYNARVPTTAAELSTERSRLVVAYPDEGFELVDDTYDFAHANARGEVKIAAAVADALAELGVGPAYARPLPEVPLGPRFAPTLSASAGDGSARLTWAQPPGAQAELVWMRDASAGEPWRELPDEVSGTEWVAGRLVNGHTYEFKLRPVRGYWAAEDDIRSNVVAVTPRPAAPGRPLVEGVTAFGSASLTWPRARGARSYQVLTRASPGSPWRLAATSTRTRAKVSGLVGGTAYRVAVRAVRDRVTSLRSPAVTARIPVPRAVREVRAARRPGAVARVSGRSVPEAASYRLYARPATSCRGPAPGPRMRLVRGGLTAPTAAYRVPTPAAWVRLRAVRSGVVGRVARSSTTCVRVR